MHFCTIQVHKHAQNVYCNFRILSNCTSKLYFIEANNRNYEKTKKNSKISDVYKNK